MSIVENKDNVTYFDGEPILFPINFLVNEMFIDVDDVPVLLV
jgi:hypothetical protein